MRSEHTCADVAVALVHGADIAGVGVVVEDLLMVVSSLRLGNDWSKWRGGLRECWSDGG